MERESGDAGKGQTYWDTVVKETLVGPTLDAWRAHMRRVYLALGRRWLPDAATTIGLKTDLFEEAVSRHGLLPDLGPGSIGLDRSLAVAKAAQRRLGREPRFLLVADLRHIPLRSESVSQVLSGSSLDHFPDKGDIAVGIRELARVLRVGGAMVITFDNPHHPIVNLRNRLPFGWLKRLGLVPYFVGATYDRHEARRQLLAAGLAVTDVTATQHAPRMLAIGVIALAERLRWRRLAAVVGRSLDGFELLERFPTRYRTGYYLAFRVEKRRPGELAP
jgi:SAM-dependent methyltransferase